MKARPLIGVGYRGFLHAWLEKNPGLSQCLEITAEHFFEDGSARLRDLSQRFPLYVHGLGLSLGTPGPLDQDILDQFVRVANTACPQWVSEHIAFTRTHNVDLGHLNPIPRTPEMLDVLTDHVLEVKERCRLPMVLENITAHLDPGGTMTETEFLNALCARTDCGLLLDVTNLFINSRNHGFNPQAWLRELPPDRIVQLHAVGYSKRDDRYHDSHCEPIQDDLLDLIRDVLSYAPVQSIIVERDDPQADLDTMHADLQRLRAL